MKCNVPSLDDDEKELDRGDNEREFMVTAEAAQG
jgi:hypothetical protein